MLDKRLDDDDASKSSAAILENCALGDPCFVSEYIKSCVGTESQSLYADIPDLGKLAETLLFSERRRDPQARTEMNSLCTVACGEKSSRICAHCSGRTFPVSMKVDDIHILTQYEIQAIWGTSHPHEDLRPEVS